MVRGRQGISGGVCAGASSFRICLQVWGPGGESLNRRRAFRSQGLGDWDQGLGASRSPSIHLSCPRVSVKSTGLVLSYCREARILRVLGGMTLHKLGLASPEEKHPIPPPHPVHVTNTKDRPVHCKSDLCPPVPRAPEMWPGDGE